MKDETILELYRQRKEDAIRETEQRYRPLLLRIALNILGNTEEAAEIVNDALLLAWSRIPPEKPRVFSAWLKKVTRFMAIDRLRTNTRKKRGGGEYDLSLSEIEEMASGEGSPDAIVESKELAQCIGKWLRMQSAEKRSLFLGRYFDFISIRDLSKTRGMTESAVKVQLLRLRNDLKQFLKKEGYDL